MAEISKMSQGYTPVSKMAKPIKVTQSIGNFAKIPTISFGNYSLQTCQDVSKKFRPMIGFELTEKQQCLLDNLWHIQSMPNTASFKVLVLNALCIYFQEQGSKATERSRPKFTHYVIFRGTKIGVFNKWETVTKFIQCPSPIYKGYCSFAEAIKIAREQFGVNQFYIEPEEVKSFSEMVKVNPEQIIQSQGETIVKLQEQIAQNQKNLQFPTEKIENDMLKQKIGLLEAKNKQLLQKLQNHEKETKLKINFDSFRARMLDLPWKETMKPVLEQFPDFEQMVSEKVCTEFPLIIYSLQQKLLDISFEERKYNGVRIVEKLIEENHEEVGTGFLLLQVHLPTNLPDDLIIQLYHYGMIDFIVFKLNPSTEQLLGRFGEKFTLVVGNMATHSNHSPSEICCKIFSSLPEMDSNSYRPPRKRIFLTDKKAHINSWFANGANRMVIDFSKLLCLHEASREEDYERKQIIKLQQTPKIPAVYDWYNFKLIAEGHYIQIWTDSFWSMFLPFIGEGEELLADHIRNTEEGFTDTDTDPGSPQTIDSTHRDF